MADPSFGLLVFWIELSNFCNSHFALWLMQRQYGCRSTNRQQGRRCSGTERPHPAAAAASVKLLSANTVCLPLLISLH